MGWTLRRCSPLPITRRSKPWLWDIKFNDVGLDAGWTWSTGQQRSGNKTTHTSVKLRRLSTRLEGVSFHIVSRISSLIFSFPTWLVSDCRRETDVQYFRETYGSVVKTVRITASDQARSRKKFYFKWQRLEDCWNWFHNTSNFHKSWQDFRYIWFRKEKYYYHLV